MPELQKENFDKKIYLHILNLNGLDMKNRINDASALTVLDRHSDESVSVSPLSVYSAYQQINVELRQPLEMPGNHVLPSGGSI